MLTEDEKWHFDIQGYVILPQAISSGDVKRMLELSDEWHALDDNELPEPISTYRDPNTKSTSPRSLNNVEYADEVFDRLCLNPEIMRVVLALTDNCPQHSGIGLARNTKETDDLPFHGGVTGGIHHPANDYQAADGKVFATFLNAGVSLVDVPAGTGFVCIPGSHKAYFPKPDNVDIYAGSPIVANPTVRAGDVVLFTEALCHGARKWTENWPRTTAFVRYTTSYASWSPGGGPLEEFNDRISPDLFELKQTASFRHRKKVVQRLLEEMGDA